jgi:uncharacterized protein YjbJ (UPF0337 family)
VATLSGKEGRTVNRDEIEGKVDELKGNVKKRIGGATEDPERQAEGWAQEKKGQVQKKIGELEKESDRKDEKEADRDITT